MEVLITGVCGFLGTHVAEYFKSEGWDVIGIDNLTTYELSRAKYDINKSRNHNLSFLQNLGIDFRIEDCKDVKHYEFRGIDLIIHCAAQPAMTIAIEDPEYDAKNNTLATINMLNVAKKLGVPFANCSSVHVYGNASNNNLKEMDTRFKSEPEEISEKNPILAGEVTPLHISKLSTELYTRFYAQMYGIKTASFRFTGMYGERQFGGMDHGWVANFAIRALTDKEITIFGTDKQVRDILYAKDAARAFKCWFDKGCPTGIYNIGGGMKNSISLRECLDYFRKFKELKVNTKPRRLGDLWYFVCDYNLAKATFGWEPQVSNEEGLGKLKDWIEAYKSIL